MKAGTVTIFLLYLSSLFYLLFFSGYRHSVQGLIDYNLVPFKSIVNYILAFDGFSFYLLKDNFFGNINAFVPFGLLLPTLFERLRSIKTIIIISFFMSLSIEITQIVFRVGSFDVDDTILNTTGAIVGYGIYCLFLKKVRNGKIYY
ncbi:VanZ family protein [Aquibacillus halophilus]|uniref:VanZ family protein n=1 Tax=Aquibacillus halophilus TaxID=930132 RepID=UPI00129A32B5